MRGFGARGTATIVWVVTDPGWLESLLQDIADHDIEMQFVWLLTTCFQAPSIVGKSCKRTWPSEAGNTSHTASPLGPYKHKFTALWALYKNIYAPSRLLR